MLTDSILALENQLLDVHFERITLYLDLFQREIVVVGHQANNSGQPIEAYERSWVKICGLPDRVVPTSVVNELLRIERALDALCDAHQNIDGDWENRLEEFLASISSLEFGVYWNPEDWYNLKDVYSLFEEGLEPEEIADYFGYFDGDDLLISKEAAIAYLLEKRRLWLEEKENEEDEDE